MEVDPKDAKDEPLWAPMFALPNIRLTAPIGVEGFLLAPPSDFRVKAIIAKQPMVGTFLTQFKTEFGTAVDPSLITWRRDKPDTYRTIPAISGLRDLIGMSVIPLSWARAHRFSRAMAPMYADAFRIYPWMVDKNGEHLITNTPVMLGVHSVEEHKGQTIAALSPHTLDERDTDRQLLPELLKRWERCFSTATPDPNDERLFRSLNMANAAAMMPAGADTQLYDTLRSVALWVSAFEILRPTRHAAFKLVYAELEKLTWNLSDCSEKKYGHVFGEEHEELKILPVWLFGELNRLRNDTLHGNPIRADRLVVAPAKRAISMYAAPLYRMMLAAYLDLKPSPRKPTGGLTEYMEHRMSMQESGQYQRDMEAALATIVTTEEEQRQQRQGLVRSAQMLSRDIASVEAIKEP